MTTEARIERMCPVHIPELVWQHQLCYPTKFATRLGEGVLAIVYRGYCEDAQAVGLVAVVDEHVVASVCGVIGDGFKNRIIRRYGFRLAWQTVRRIIFDPRVLLELVGRVGSLWRRKPGDAPRAHERRFVWRSQTVEPAWRGKGTILPLVKAMLETLRQRGVEEVYSTPEADNVASVWIHRVFHFHRVGEALDEDGRVLTIFTLPLGRSAGSETPCVT